MVTVCACSPQGQQGSATGPVPNSGDSDEIGVRLNFGRRGEADTFSAVCKAELRELPPPLATFHFLVEHGGYTCGTNRGTWIFVPRRDGRCAQSADIKMSGLQVVSVEEASRDYRSCAAISHPGSAEETEVITIRPTAGFEEEFRSFGLDLVALSSHDALPVTSLSWAGDLICLESVKAAPVIRRIQAADIADASTYTVAAEKGTCRAVGRRLLPHGFPEVSPDP